MKLLGSNKCKITKNINFENVSNLEMTKAVLVYNNIVKYKLSGKLKILLYLCPK